MSARRSATGRNDRASALREAAPAAPVQRLLVISPVRDEQAHIERVAAAVASQIRQPDAWVVIDDGSTDETPDILAALLVEIPFLTVLRAPERSAAAKATDRLALAAEARAFNLALAGVRWRSFTHVAKLDGDTELPPRYFERLLAEFAADPRLGLAGGVYADPVKGGTRWRVVRIPHEHHVPGSLKCWSLPCFEAIGGVQERLGWDTIDETYARMHGYATRSLPELVALHHRPWGTADGALRGRARHGACAYVARFTLPWVMLRSLKVARAKPLLLSGFAFLYGYLSAMLRGAQRVEDPDFARFVRRELRARVLAAALSTPLLAGAFRPKSSRTTSSPPC